MRNVYLILLVIFLPLNIYAQDYNNIWQLGPTKINFTTNPPLATVNTSLPDIDEYGNNSFSSCSDVNGNLLFYFNGRYFYNKNNQSIFNTYPTLYHAHQGTIILPHPANVNQYYLIWNTHLALLNGQPGRVFYSYAIMDFTNNSLGELKVLQTNSNGYETPYNKTFRDSNNEIVESINLDLRPLTFTKNFSNDGYWIILQKGNKLLSYELTGTGLNLIPVETTFPANTIFHGVTPYGNGGAMFRFNDTGSKLYGLEYAFNNFYSLNFNNLTGTFSNYESIVVNSTGSMLRNFEFSSDYSKVYFIREYGTDYQNHPLSGEIIIKDLNSSSLPARLIYEFDNPSIASVRFSVLQKDKYNNLLVGSRYSSLPKAQYIHKIENQNSYSNASVKLNYIYLNGKTIIGFPQLIEPLTDTCPQDITLTTTESNLSHTYQAANSVTAQTAYVVESGHDITFKAGEFNVLKDITHIKYGAVFLAAIEECESTIPITPYSSQERTSGANQIGEPSLALKLSPNPSRDEVLLTSQKAIAGITITSFDGKVMYSREFSGKDTEVRVIVSNYIKGIYLVTVKNTDGTIETAKLLKE